MIVVDKLIDLPTLLTEIQAAGVEIDDLGTAGDRLVTYDEEGHTVDLDDERIPPVLVAHVPPEPPPSKSDILLMMLESVEPGAEDTEILWLVLQESLRP